MENFYIPPLWNDGPKKQKKRQVCFRRYSEVKYLKTALQQPAFVGEELFKESKAELDISIAKLR